MPTGARLNGSRKERVDKVFSDLPLRPTKVPRRVKRVCDAESETERSEKGVPMTSKWASSSVLATAGVRSCDQSEQHLPGETAGVAAASTLSAWSRAGSVEEVVAEMLMHLLRTVAAEARCAKLLQGEAAGRSMAVPVNWRACSRAGL
jgi:hypothetical protein